MIASFGQFDTVTGTMPSMGPAGAFDSPAISPAIDPGMTVYDPTYGPQDMTVDPDFDHPTQQEMMWQQQTDRLLMPDPVRQVQEFERGPTYSETPQEIKKQLEQWQTPSEYTDPVMAPGDHTKLSPVAQEIAYRQDAEAGTEKKSWLEYLPFVGIGLGVYRAFFQGG